MAPWGIRTRTGAYCMRLTLYETLGMINKPIDSTGRHPLHESVPDLVRAIFAFADFSIDRGERVVEAIIFPCPGHWLII